MRPSPAIPAWSETVPNFETFLTWEAKSWDVIAFRAIYADMCQDVLAGLLLSQIVYWHLPDRDGGQKLRVYKRGKWWIAKSRAEWFDEIRLSVKQVDHAVKLLKKRGLIETRNMLFAGARVQHIHLNGTRFMELWRDTHGVRSSPEFATANTYSQAKKRLQLDHNVE